MRLSWDEIEQPPFTSEMAMLHMRLDGDDDLQSLAENIYLKAAVDWAEGATHRSTSARTHRLVLERFPYHQRHILLPRGICSAVESIVYYDDTGPVTLSGPTSTVPGTDYQEDLSSLSGGVLMPPKGDSWPSVDREVIKPVEITYTAGWLIAPQDIQAAIFCYANALLEQESTDYQMAETLISGWKIQRFG